jgi:hypothetical protein
MVALQRLDVVARLSDAGRMPAARRLVTALTLTLLAGCPRPQRSGGDAPRPARPPRADAGRAAAAWPALPRSAAEAEQLVKVRTLRDPGRASPAPVAPERLLALPALSDGQKLLAGAPAVWAALQRRLDDARGAGRSAYLLFGTFHDSGAQIEAFRRALGAAALSGFGAVTVEQLDADGAWAGVPAAEQRGDGALLERILGEGERRDLAELEARQIQQDYTAWKFGFVGQVVDLATAARALRLPLAGCDMPRRLQERLPAGSPARDRLRELHCLLALEDRLARAPRGPRQVAMLWGQDHVRPHGLPRFLPADALVLSLHLVGARPGPLTPEAELSRRLVVDDLLLVPLDAAGEQLALLLPGVPLGGELRRSRELVPGPARGPALLRVTSEAAGELFVAGRRLRVGPHEQELELPPSPASAYLLRTARLRMAGSVEVQPGSTVELSFDPARRTTQLHQLLRRD